MTSSPNVSSLASLDQTPSADLAHLPKAVQDTLAIRERFKREFLEARARNRANPNHVRLGTTPLDPLTDNRVMTWESAPLGPYRGWQGTLMGTGGKRRLFGPT